MMTAVNAPERALAVRDVHNHQYRILLSKLSLLVLTYFLLYYITLVFASRTPEKPTIVDPFENQIKYFETLQVSDVRTRHLSKRETAQSGVAGKSGNDIKEVSFHALGRSFQLILAPTRGLLSNKFRAFAVNGAGMRQQVTVDNSQFFEGKLVGESDSNVSAHIDDGLLTASIHVSDEVYIVEPSWRHVDAFRLRQQRHAPSMSKLHTTDGHSATADYDIDNGMPASNSGFEVRNDDIATNVSSEGWDFESARGMIVYRASDVIYNLENSRHESGSGSHQLSSTRFCGVQYNNETLIIDSDLADDSKYLRTLGKRELVREGPDDLGPDDSSSTAGGVVGEPLRQYEPTQTRCSLLLVADHKFYENMGGKSQKATINFIIALIDRVNKIFLDTEWKDNERQQGFRGMGFVIQEVLVHTEPTPVANGQEHYNMAGRSNWNVRELLEVFSRSENHRWFCLAHLFTDQKFEGGILGLAYVGSPRKNSVGGICSPGYVKNGHTLYLNSGLSTSRNHYGHRVITREADLVTAHEFGHNWGGEHDPDVTECSPDSQKGGSYLMYTYSVSGYDANNKRFSPCSVRSIRAVLLAKAGKCFSKPEESFCGNLLVEEGEECDAGLGGSSAGSSSAGGSVSSEAGGSGSSAGAGTDPCCSAQCKLKPGARCSDRNSPCCRDCQFMEAGILCRESMPNACKKEAFCSGESADCPPSKPQNDDSPCLDRGKCRAGECLPYCETLGLQSCMCDSEPDACKRCCRPSPPRSASSGNDGAGLSSSSSDQHHMSSTPLPPIPSKNGTCQPIEPIEILLDGTPCIHGFCEEGTCRKTVQDIVERFWDIIEDIDINTLLKFLHDNIVSFVLVLLSVLWIPVSCLISYADRQHYRELQRWAASRPPASNKRQPFALPEDPSVKVIKIPKNFKVLAAANSSACGLNGRIVGGSAGVAALSSQIQPSGCSSVDNTCTGISGDPSSGSIDSTTMPVSGPSFLGTSRQPWSQSGYVARNPVLFTTSQNTTRPSICPSSLFTHSHHQQVTKEPRPSADTCFDGGEVHAAANTMTTPSASVVCCGSRESSSATGNGVVSRPTVYAMGQPSLVENILASGSVLRERRRGAGVGNFEDDASSASPIGCVSPYPLPPPRYLHHSHLNTISSRQPKNDFRHRDVLAGSDNVVSDSVGSVTQHEFEMTDLASGVVPGPSPAINHIVDSCSPSGRVGLIPSGGESSNSFENNLGFNQSQQYHHQILNHLGRQQSQRPQLQLDTLDPRYHMPVTSITTGGNDNGQTEKSYDYGHVYLAAFPSGFENSGEHAAVCLSQHQHPLHLFSHASSATRSTEDSKGQHHVLRDRSSDFL